jgi:alkanesulfonate monooxygenase SsuD/methylene tetrahydromethanopterin reductase-like flavin-dependent oxidoreductase (luciferase family)
MAGQLGAGYSFAAHFSPTPPKPAFDAYRAAFQPSAAFPEPRAILAVSAVVAPTDEEAKFLSGSQALSWALFHSGQIRKLLSPEDAAAHEYSAHERHIIENQSPLWIIGSPETVKAEIAHKAKAAGADEVMVTTTIWDYALRLRSFRLLAEAFGL